SRPFAVSGTHSPSAEGIAPRTLQGRLTLAFVAVVAVTLGLVGLLVINRLGAYFDQQQRDDLKARASGVAAYVFLVADNASPLRPVVARDGTVEPSVVLEFQKAAERQFL